MTGAVNADEAQKEKPPEGGLDQVAINAGLDFRANDHGTSRQSPDAAQPPRPQISNHRELCAASANVRCRLRSDRRAEISEPVAADQLGDISKRFSQSRSAFARFAVRPFRLLPGGQNDILRCGRIVGQLDLWQAPVWSFGLWWSNHMPIKPLATTEWDRTHARRIERSWEPFFFKRLSSAEAEIVVRAIAQGIAEGRKQGLELAKAPKH
jgi:hypothetical protein